MKLINAEILAIADDLQDFIDTKLSENFRCTNDSTRMTFKHRHAIRIALRRYIKQFHDSQIDTNT
jgi:hypothetical protein